MRMLYEMTPSLRSLRIMVTVLWLCTGAGSAYGAEQSPDEPARERSAHSTAVLYRQAKQAVTHKQYDLALTLVEEGLALDPAYLPLLKQRAQVLMRLGRHEEATKSIALALAAMPDDIELNELAAGNILLKDNANSEKLRKDLSDHLRKTAPSTLPKVVAGLARDYDGTENEADILFSLGASATLQERENEVLAAITRGEADKAATMVLESASSLTERDPRAPVIAALAYKAAVSLAPEKEASRIDELFDAAGRLGFDRSRLVFAKAASYSRAGKPKKAAEIFSSFYRHSSQPNQVAVKAAENFVQAGQPQQALDILRKALSASPNEPYPQGQYLYLLGTHGAKQELEAYAAMLEKHGEHIGLHYGRYLLARKSNDSDAVKDEYAKLMLAMKSNTDLHSHESLASIHESIGREKPYSDPLLGSYIMEAWKAWEAGLYAEASRYWMDAFDLGLGSNKPYVHKIASILHSHGMKKEADAMISAYYPDAPAYAFLRFPAGGGSGGVDYGAVLNKLYLDFRRHIEHMEYIPARTIRSRIASLVAKGAGGYSAGIYLALCDLGLGRYAAAEANLRGILRKSRGNSRAIIDLAAVLNAQGRYQEARDLLARHGLQDPDQLGVLQYRTRLALKNNMPEEAEEHAREYLKRNADSTYMHDLYDQALLRQHKTAEARTHAKATLERNDIQVNALQTLFSSAIMENLKEEAAVIARQIADIFPHDPNSRIEAAVQSTDLRSFRYMFERLETMTAHGPNGAMSAWVVPSLTAYKDEDSFSLEDLERHIKKIKEKYNLVGLSAVPVQSGGGDVSGKPERPPLLLVIGVANAADISAADAILQRHQGRAALLVGEESFMDGGPENRPDYRLLQRLAGTGRWDFILTDTVRKNIIVDEHGNKRSFWSGPAWTDGRLETLEELRARWDSTLAGIRERARSRGFVIDAWMYPGGDYGQYRLDVNEAVRQVMDSAVAARFPTAFVATPTGYHMQGTSPSRIPARFLYTPLPNEKIREHIFTHPTRRATLAEGVAASWHRQTARAERLFLRAAEYGCDMKDVVYYRATNALYTGDVADANILARMAQVLDPESRRVAALLEKAERLKRPRVSLTPRIWTDDDDRDFSEYRMTFSTHVTDRVALSGHVSALSWGNDDGTTKGMAGGIGLRVYPFSQHWVDLSVRGVTPDDGYDSFGEWSVAWNGAHAMDFLNLNGRYQLLYQRESIETRESIEEGIYADRFSLNGEFRYLNWGVFAYDAFAVARTDGNNTFGLSLRPGYILLDKPLIQIDYHFDLADSDRNPDEYYAPKGYQSHMASISIRHNVTEWLSVNAMARYGLAKSESRDWDSVFRYGAGISVKITESLSFETGYRRLELPDYKMNTFTMGLQYVF